MVNRLKYAKCRNYDKTRSPITGLCMSKKEILVEDKERTLQFFLPKYGVRGKMNYSNEKFLPPWVENQKDRAMVRLMLSECLKNGVNLQLESKDGYPLWHRSGKPRWKSLKQIKDECLNKYTTPINPTTQESLFIIDKTSNPTVDIPYEWINTEEDIDLSNTTWTDNTTDETFEKILRGVKSGGEMITGMTYFERILLKITLDWLSLPSEEEFFKKIERRYRNLILPQEEIEVLYGWTEILAYHWNCSKPQKEKIKLILNRFFQGDQRPLSFIKNKLCPLKN